MSIGNALYSQITVKNGSVEQSNYTDYLVPRIDITPGDPRLFRRKHASAGRRRRARRAAHRTGDLQCDLCSHWQTDQGTAGRSPAVEGLKKTAQERLAASVTSSLSQEESSNMSDAPDADRGLTDRVLKSYSSIEEPRLRSLVLALIRHLHAYVGETKLTDQEWEFAWNFMGRMAAVPDRNEFLLAGDVLGVSQLLETLNHDWPGQSVGFALVGPFLRADAPFRKRGDSIASDDTPGARGPGFRKSIRCRE